MTSELRARWKTHVTHLAVGTVFAALSAWLLGMAWAASNNTLKRHQDWHSSKTSLEMSVMGSIAFVRSRPALAGEQLDLGAYFGFQELVRTEEAQLSVFEASFRLERQGYIDVLYDIRPNGFAGVRFSSREGQPNFHFRATPRRKFLSKEPLQIATQIEAEEWHDVQLRFEEKRVQVVLDGESVGSFDRTPGPQRVGFRGGHRHARVDDVLLRHAGGRVVVEGFRDEPVFERVSRIALGSLLLPGLLAALVGVRILSRDPRRVGLTVVVAMGVLSVVSGLVYGYQRQTASDYPVPDPAQEAQWKDGATMRMLAEMQGLYGQAARSNQRRVLVLGTSQSWRSGADSRERTWVRLLERNVNEATVTGEFQFMNASVRGLDARRIAALLSDELLAYEPDVALINLSNNDRDPEELREGLSSIVRMLTEKRVRTLLLLEANSPERQAGDTPHGDLASKHQVVREVAEEYDLPVFDMHAYLAERESEGHLWWDFVHLTSYGQRLLAQGLRAELDKLSELDRSR